jgi:hypothetical protein
MRDTPLSFVLLVGATLISPTWTPIDDQWVQEHQQTETILHCDSDVVECNEEGTCCNKDTICELGGSCFHIYRGEQ